jgi:hypothetical protein
VQRRTHGDRAARCCHGLRSCRGAAGYTDATERLVAALAKLVKKLGAKNPEALAWSAMAEMAGALTLSRAVSDPETSNAILRNSRAMVKSRLGLDRRAQRVG